jgi:hypothetical protein
MSSSNLLLILTQYPALAGLPIDTLVTGLDLLRHLKERVLWNGSSQLVDPPVTLPHSIHHFVRDALAVTDEDAKVLWEAFRFMAWAEASDDHSKRRNAALLPLFLRHGPTYSVGE